MQQASEKKYTILENETKNFFGHTLYRIQAIKDFANVKAGDKGGWIESEKNLSQEGNCWVYGDSKVFDNAEVRDSAKVFTSSEVYGNAKVFDNAKIFAFSSVYDNSVVCNDAQVYGHAVICGDAEVTSEEDYFVFEDDIDYLCNFTYTKSNKKWKTETFYGNDKELIKNGYEISVEYGKMYETCVYFVKQQEETEKELSKS